MIKRTFVTRKLSICLLLCYSILLLNAQNVWTDQSGLLNLLQPTSQSSEKSAQQGIQQETEPFIKRIGEVSLSSVDTFLKEMAPGETSSRNISFKGMQLLMSFFPEKEMTVTVDSESRSANVISLRGHQVDSDISTFSMTITQKNYLITYQDIDNAVIYRVVGNVGSGIGKVVEIDLKKLPPTYDLPAVPPPPAD